MFSPRPLAYLPHQDFNRLGAAGANGIDHHDFARARLECGEIDFPQEVEFGASSVDGEVRDCNPVLLGEPDRVGNALEHFFAREARLSA